MARKRRAPSSPPPPPPPPPQESDAEESPPKVVSHAADPAVAEPSSDVDVNAFQMRPVPHPASEADDSSESEHEVPEPAQKNAAAAMTSSSKATDKKRPHPRSEAEESSESELEVAEPVHKKAAAATTGNSKAAVPADKRSHPGSEAEESSESEPEDPEPVQKKAAAAATTNSKAVVPAATTTNSKAAVPADKKRPAPEPAPSGIAKRTRAQPGKAEPEAAPAGKGKNANAEREKTAPEATPPAKGKNANAEREKAAPEATTPAAKGKKQVQKPVVKAENPAIDSLPVSKSAPAKQRWSDADLMKILETMAAHVKTEGAPPKIDFLIDNLRGDLDRKDCSYTDMYERVRTFKRRYNKAVERGVVPKGADELKMYNLSEEIWGEKAKEAMPAAAAASQNDPAVAKTKKGRAKKESKVPNQSGDTQKGSKKSHAVEVETDKAGKSKLSKDDTAAASTNKDKKLGNRKQELGKDAKSGTLKEAATAATQGGDDVTKRKGKMPDDTLDIDLMPKEASTDSQNGGAGTEKETHQEETEIGASARGAHRSFDELEGLYPCLAGYVKKFEAEHPCGETMKRAFGFIGDEKANALESKIKALKISEVKAQIDLQRIQKEIFKCLF